MPRADSSRGANGEIGEVLRVAGVVDVDPAIALADCAGAGEHDLATVEQRHQRAVTRAGYGTDGVETYAAFTAAGAAGELV